MDAPQLFARGAGPLWDVCTNLDSPLTEMLSLRPRCIHQVKLKTFAALRLVPCTLAVLAL